MRPSSTETSRLHASGQSSGHMRWSSVGTGMRQGYSSAVCGGVSVLIGGARRARSEDAEKGEREEGRAKREEKREEGACSLSFLCSSSSFFPLLLLPPPSSSPRPHSASSAPLFLFLRQKAPPR